MKEITSQKILFKLKKKKKKKKSDSEGQEAIAFILFYILNRFRLFFLSLINY